MASEGTALNLDIVGMTCASCVRRVERALAKVPGVETASVNLAAETARVTLAAPVEMERLVAAVEKAGYQAAPAAAREEREAERDSRSRRTLVELLIFGALSIPTIILAMAMDIAGMHINDDPQLHGWLVLLLATPIQFGLGWRFYRGAWASLRHLNPNMDVLVALGTSVAYGYSAWVVLADRNETMFFDVSAAVLVFITMGKYFEESSKRSASSAIRALLGLGARSASVLRDGVEVEVAAESLLVGDRFIVRPGQRVPTDGVVRDGHSTVDESMVTGESLPVERKPGDAVIGGTINQNGVVTVEATAVGEATVLRRMAQLVEEAQGSKAPIQRLVDQVAAIFVPAVIVFAVLTFVAWGVVSGGWQDGMVAAVAVLVIACPCALGLATPTAIMVGTGLGAERGILIRNADVLQRTRSLNVVVLDKTGTLTEGRPQVTDVVPLGALGRDDLLVLAAAAESGSEHPLSRAVVDAAVEKGLTIPSAGQFEAFTARGVQAMVDGRLVMVGNPQLFEEAGFDLESLGEKIGTLQAEGRTAVVVAVDGRLEGVFGIADSIKQNAPRAVAALQTLGLRVVMMTGDNERAARVVARAAGIEEVRANARPEDKLALVRELQASGLSVAMVGDGINDAPALAQADVGIAMSTGADVAIEAGDITLLHGDVARVAEAIALSRATLSTIRQNLAWAFGYNLVMIPVAAAGLLNPVLAGAAMALSSVSVMANSLRLGTKARTVARAAGNEYGAGKERMVAAARGPLFAMTSATALLVLPLFLFSGIERGWFSNEPATPAGSIRVELSNWKVSPAQSSTRAGNVTFQAIHLNEQGHGHGDSGPGKTHDLVVLKQLQDGSFEVVGRTRPIGPGNSAALTVDLTPGEYSLACDVVEEIDGKPTGHSALGMITPFTVTTPS